MGIREVLAAMQEKGLPFDPRRLYAAMKAGHVAEPPRDLGGRFVFTKRHVRQIEAYLRHPPTPGRPRAVSVA